MEEPKDFTRIFAGDSVEMSCKAESAPGVDLTYLWYKCYKTGHVEGLVENCTGNKMVISKATQLHQGYYKCVISSAEVNSPAEVSSRVAYVEVMTPNDIKFTTQPPLKHPIKIGEELILNCVAECENYPVTYQWHRNEKPLLNANRSRLVILQVAGEDCGFYHCEVRSEYSAQVAYSATTQIQLCEFVFTLTCFPPILYVVS